MTLTHQESPFASSAGKRPAAGLRHSRAPGIANTKIAVSERDFAGLVIGFVEDCDKSGAARHNPRTVGCYLDCAGKAKATTALGAALDSALYDFHDAEHGPIQSTGEEIEIQPRQRPA